MVTWPRKYTPFFASNRTDQADRVVVCSAESLVIQVSGNWTNPYLPPVLPLNIIWTDLMENRTNRQNNRSALCQVLIAFIVFSVLVCGYLFTSRRPLLVKAKPDKRWKKDTTSTDSSGYRQQIYRALTGQLERELESKNIPFSMVRISPDRIMVISTDENITTDISQREKLCLLAEKYYLNGVRLLGNDGNPIDCISCKFQ